MKDYLISVVIGDTAGGPYEFRGSRSKDETKINLRLGKKFTDDSVCTFAVASYLLGNGKTLEQTLRECCKLEPKAGYGGMFRKWLWNDEMGPYGSYGNGSAMRVSSVSILANSEDEVLNMAEETCAPTHDHPSAILGAQVTALLGYRLLHGDGKECAEELLHKYYPEWTKTYKELQKVYSFRPSAQETVPAAIIAFLESNSFEDCLLKNIALGGDADTLCAIAAPWAYAYYKELPQDLYLKALQRLPRWMEKINMKMNERFQ